MSQVDNLKNQWDGIDMFLSAAYRKNVTNELIQNVNSLAYKNIHSKNLKKFLDRRA